MHMRKLISDRICLEAAFLQYQFKYLFISRITQNKYQIMYTRLYIYSIYIYTLMFVHYV